MAALPAEGGRAHSRPYPPWGFHHHIENLAADGFQGIHSADKEVLRYFGRPDHLQRTATVGVFKQYEYKNLGRGQLLGNKSQNQLRENILAALGRVDGFDPATALETVAAELRDIRYVYRGAELANPGLRQQMNRIVKESLPPRFKHLADELIKSGGSMIEFQGKGVPF